MLSEEEKTTHTPKEENKEITEEDRIALYVVGSHVRIYFDKKCLSLPQDVFKKLLNDYITSWKNPIIGHI